MINGGFEGAVVQLITHDTKEASWLVPCIHEEGIDSLWLCLREVEVKFL